MDAIAGLLDGPRAREAFLPRRSMEPPWSLRIRDEAPLTVLALVRGEAWAVHDGAEPVVLRAGDVAIVRGPEPYTVADAPATAPQIAIEPGEVCRSLAPGGGTLLESFRLGVRTWGNAADGATVMLTGTYTVAGEVSGRLLRARRGRPARRSPGASPRSSASRRWRSSRRSGWRSPRTCSSSPAPRSAPSPRRWAARRRSR